MLARLKRLLGVKGSSHGGETNGSAMLAEQPADLTPYIVNVVRLRAGSWRIYVPPSCIIELRGSAGNSLALFYPNAVDRVIVGSPDPKPPV
jgi:hypothetical protein